MRADTNPIIAPEDVVSPSRGIQSGEPGVYWRYHRDPAGVVWAWWKGALPVAAESQNNQAWLWWQELDQILHQITSPNPPLGALGDPPSTDREIGVLGTVALVIQSDQPSGWGGDQPGDGIACWGTDPAAWSDGWAWGWRVLHRLSALPIPTIAVIQGACMGVAWELALACRYRLAWAGDQRVRVGFPDAPSGLVPVWGALWRLSQRTGAAHAWAMGYGGRTLFAAAAYRQGLLDGWVHPWELEQMVGDLKTADRPRPLNRWETLRITGRSWRYRISQLPAIRAVLGRVCQARFTSDTAFPDGVAAAACSPDPDFEVPAVFPEQPPDRAVAIAQSESMMQALARHRLAATLRAEALRAGPVLQGNPPVMAVMGLGRAGWDLVVCGLIQGYRVIADDPDPGVLATVRTLLATRFPDYPPPVLEAIADRLVVDPGHQGMGHADVVVEALESSADPVSAKQGWWASVGTRVPSHALLITHTAGVPLAAIASVCPNPERLVGIHMPPAWGSVRWVALAHAEGEPSDCHRHAAVWVASLGAVPMPTAPVTGLLFNRILAPYLTEAWMLYEEGVLPERIDQAAHQFGIPVGPWAYLQQEGMAHYLPLMAQIGQTLEDNAPFAEGMRDRLLQVEIPPPSPFARLRRLLPARAASRTVPADLTHRLVGRLVQGALWAWRDRLVPDPAWIDHVLVWSGCFPAAQGGPIHAIRQQGGNGLLQRHAELVKRYGDRFQLEPGLWGIGDQ